MGRKVSAIAVNDLIQSIGLLVRRVRAAAGAHEMSLTESAVLARIANGGAATIAELARAESMRPQSMGATVASLEEMGLVERKPHPTDGRQVHIELTTNGASVRKSAREAKRTWLAEAISELDEREQEILFQSAGIIRRLVGKA